MDFKGEPIAIIGSGCRFPGNVNTPSQLWELLRNPRLVSQKITTRFGSDGFYHPNGQVAGHSDVREAYLLTGHSDDNDGNDDDPHRRFDAAFFRVKPQEASVMDPQARLLLETVYEALESAGQTVEGLCGSDTAVYAGQMTDDYSQLMGRDLDTLDVYHAYGMSRAMLANRVSYFFDWHGPSITIDTACSSSLVAVHLAVQQLRSGQSRTAVAAGANLVLDHLGFVAMSSLQMLSPDGRSRMWDVDANGYARAEGIAAVVLKTLSAAEADGDDIECIIRETALNQDGRTSGITMPSAAAQSQLIRDCYIRAGLDPVAKLADRPQYFECHGTGTQVGDSNEAEAISTAFFPNGGVPGAHRLLVGGIKSILGHSEGTAGLAGLLKTSLALKHAIVPPNLLLNNLNPRVQPFYRNLEVPLREHRWPDVDLRSPRRASVNSFGFGGANAHAILESYTPAVTLQSSTDVFTPFLFSAASEKSLCRSLIRMRDHVWASQADLGLRDLSYTLYARRSSLQVATSIAASSAEDLCEKLDAEIQALRMPDSQTATTRRTQAQPDKRNPAILGVFTGQGAQWATMGADLIARSAFARNIMASLEARLEQLPPSDRPTWSLTQELQKDATHSRLFEASISQPLCTAVQILQVELLQAAGIAFSAIVGHSSGEIAAAFAAGLISAGDAICIAYYRGLYTALAQGSDGKPGAMIAVGTSAADAYELCEDPEFQGRVHVAAINAPASVTISGDRDAIDELIVVLDDEKKFARILKVDKAYHSHHMWHCLDPYLKALAALGIRARGHAAKCAWISSVHKGIDMSSASSANQFNLLDGKYWASNMEKPVLFMQSVLEAVSSHGPFDIAIEVGPHPALNGPVKQTIVSGGQDMPYTGLLRRGEPAIESVAKGLGYIWTHLDSSNGPVDLLAYDRVMSECGSPRMLKGLPTYAWDHEKLYWHEPRVTRATRQRAAVHDLLGHRTPNSTEHDMRWRHFLSPKNLPWLLGHRLQNQVVFPAAGFVVMAIEAALFICAGSIPSLIEVVGLEIGKALTFDSDESAVEVLVSMSNIMREGPSGSSTGVFQATFKCNAAATGPDTLHLVASGSVRVLLGQPTDDVLPEKPPRPTNLLTLRDNDFYEGAAELEYQYSGAFAALVGVERKLGAATGRISLIEPSEPLLLHPAVLDVAFQAVLVAFSAPEDGSLFSLHVPRSIDLVRVNPQLCARELARSNKKRDDTKPTEPPSLIFHAECAPDESTVCGDVDVFPSQGKDSAQYALIQIQHLECVPLSRPTESDDREAFSTIVWDVAQPDCQLAVAEVNTQIEAETAVVDIYPPRTSTQDEQRQLGRDLERIAGFYLRVLDREIPQDHPCRTDEPTTHLFRFAQHTIARQRAGQVARWLPEWEADTNEDVARITREGHARLVDIQLLDVVGRNITDIVRGDISALEVVSNSNDARGWGRLQQYYTQGSSLSLFRDDLTCVVRQMAHANPHMHIVEVGAGTGAGTTAALDGLGTAFASYTFTDISLGFLDAADPWISALPAATKVDRKLLDIGRDPVEQGFVAGTFDMVLAFSVLHATPVLEQTLRNTRRLLKPGGYLLAVEPLPTDMAFFGVVFGAMPGWWSGAGEGRALSPARDVAEWDALLRRTRFSGVDTAVSRPDHPLMPAVLFISQATDERIDFLRSPLASSVLPGMFDTDAVIQDLIILGGGDDHDQIPGLANEAHHLISPHCGTVTMVPSLYDLLDSQDCISQATTTVLALVDLREPSMLRLDAEKWDALKKLVLSSATLVWVTSGRQANNPYANMMLGLLRSAVQEVHGLEYHFLDFEDACEINARRIVEALLTFKAGTLWRKAEAIQMPMETEIVVGQHGRALIPRAKISQTMNDRYNSVRRLITVPAQPHEQKISIAPSQVGLGFTLQQEARPINYSRSDAGDVQGAIRSTRSILCAVRVTEAGSLFIMAGQDRVHPAQQVITLSSTQSSLVDAWEQVSVPVSAKDASEPRLLCLVAQHFLAWTIFRGMRHGDNAWVHDPDASTAAVLEKEARTAGVRLTISTVSIKAQNPRHINSGSSTRWIGISPTVPGRTIAPLLRERVSVFIDMTNSTESSPASNIGRSIRSRLSAHCRKYDLASLLGEKAYPPPSFQRDDIHSALDRALAQSLDILADTTSLDGGSLVFSPTVIGLDEVAQRPSNNPALDCIIDWTYCSSVQVTLQPIDSLITFPPDRTYWLAGLSGTLGLSLCEWMVRHGAKYVVISSRAPSVDRVWLEEMEAQGAVVAVQTCDVVQRAEVVAIHAQLSSTWPPIAGVVQGAMVLEDTSFQDMSLDTFLKVSRPKVEGSVHLSDLFQTDTVDFFVFLSSTVAVVGRPGQANYSAANMFMVSLAEQRRRRGLAASVMHIGPLRGVGALSQMDERIFSRARRQAAAFVFMAEREFHQMFAEAIVAGRGRTRHRHTAHHWPNQAETALELFSGLRRVDLGDTQKPAWASQPLMTHFIKGSEGKHSGLTPAASSKSSLPVKVQLAQARSSGQVSEIVQRALELKLCSMFHMDPSKLDNRDSHEALAYSRLDHLGIDSLLAVELRGWFMKTLEVNIPVLKILSGVSVGELVSIAAESIPMGWLPKLQGAPESDAPTAADLALTGTREPSPHEIPTTIINNLAGDFTDIEVPPTAVGEGGAISVDERSHQGDSTATLDEQSDKCSETLNNGVADINESNEISAPSTSKLESNQIATCEARTTTVKSFQLSFSQRMLWFVTQFLEDKTSLNHTGWIRWSGRMRVDDLARALREVGQRHEALRTCFVEGEDGRPMQGIMESSRLRLETREISSEDEVTLEAQGLRESHVFDLARGEAVRILLLTRTATDHFIVAGFHPIVLDATSLQVFFDDLIFHYTGPHSDRDPQRAVPQFSEFSERQHADHAAGVFQDGLRYWRAELLPPPPALPVLSLSGATLRPTLTSHDNVKASCIISRETVESIKGVCGAYGVTQFHFYLAVFQALIQRYAPVDEEDSLDIVVGISDANRIEHEMMGCVGPFANLLPVRLQSSSSVPFRQLLMHVRTKAYSALANGRVPFEVLLDNLGVARSETSTPIFQSFLNYRRQDVRLAGSYGDNVQLQLLAAEVSRMGYDVTLDLVDEHNSEARCTFLLRRDLYGEDEARRLAHSFRRLVDAFSKDPSLSLVDPDIFDPAEVKQALQYGQGPLWSPVWPETAIHRFDDVASYRRAYTAVSCGDVNWTYQEIMDQVSDVATALQAAGVLHGSLVAVLVEPTAFWVTSVLGIWRIGAVYLPLEPSTPPTHLASIINNCQAGALLVDNGTNHYADSLGRIGTLSIIDLSQIPQHQGRTIPISATANGLAVILYTSGSSGSPKGIPITHNNLMNLFEPMSKVYDIGPDEVVLQQTTPTFDLSLFQLSMALMLGGSICILPRHQRGDAHAITDLIASRGVTITGATPTEYNAWLKNGKQRLARCLKWRRAFSVGELMSPSLVLQFAGVRGRLPGLELWNLYGPTETTFLATSMRVPLLSSSGSTSVSGSPPPTIRPGPTATTAAAAGHPQPNYTVHVLDSQMRPLPAGVQGEIYIGGEGVSSGYMNNGPLTASRFVPDPFAPPGRRATLHRTGDLGRWRRDDGALLVEGRIAGDTQVKLRGMRLDLAAVEHALVAVGGDAVREVAVSLRRSEAGVELLVAHVVLRGGEDWQRRGGSELEHMLRQGLAEKVPRYMCPAAIIPVPSLPRTTSGKLDRKAIAQLPIDSPERLGVDDNGCARGGDGDIGLEQATAITTETRLRHIWSGVLPVSPISSKHITPRTDFFHVGGSSLLLLRLQEGIREAWGVQMPLIKMFEASTLADMARWIDHGITGPPDSKRQPDGIDWESEVSMSSTLEAITPGSDAHAGENAGRVVVLTGATGLVGGALLRALVRCPSISHVHCIAVRQPARPQCQELVGSLAPWQDKVTLHEGDLNLPRLGLSERGAQLVFGAAHAVVHCAADMSTLKTYASLRAPNVQATKEMAEMCAAVGRTIPLHYVSSVASGRFAAEKCHGRGDGNDVGFVLRPVSVAEYPPSSSWTGGGAGLADSEAPVGYSYAASKWASEIFLERLSACHPAWRIRVHHPSLLVPETWHDAEPNGEPSSKTFNSLELLSNLRHYFGLLENMALSVPSGDVIRGEWDLVPVQTVVEGIMDAVLEDIAPEGNADIATQHGQIHEKLHSTGDAGISGSNKSFRILHHIGGVQISTMDLREWLITQIDTGRDAEQKVEGNTDVEGSKSTKEGEKRQEVGLVEWAKAAGDLGMHPTFVAMFETLAAPNGGVIFPSVVKQ